jgi:hypothetical protein
VLHRDRFGLAGTDRRAHQRLFERSGVPAASRGEKFQVVGAMIW